MPDGPTDPRWPTLLSLSAHELRSPLSALMGYLRMLKDRAGPLSDPQRRLLEKAEESCARLSSLVREMSDLSQLESGTARFNRGIVNLQAILADAIAARPEQDRTVTIELTVDKTITVRGDAVRLRTAFTAILHALGRELVMSDQLVVRVDAREDDPPSLLIIVGDTIRIDALRRLEQSDLVAFDEWRGGTGLSLPTARRIIESHGGRLWSPAEDGKSSAIVILPRPVAGA